MARLNLLLSFVAAALVVLAMPAAAYDGPSRLARSTLDTSPPTIQQPANMTFSVSPGQTFRQVNFTLNATDPDNPPSEITINCSWSTLGVSFKADTTATATLSVGIYTMNCYAWDLSGNVSPTISFILSVFVDTTPPVIQVSNQTIPATSPAGATLFYTVGVSDPDDAASSIAVICDHSLNGGLFPIGVTTVTCNATDAAGNKATPTSFTVTVTNTNTTTTTTTVPTTTTTGSTTTTAPAPPPPPTTTTATTPATTTTAATTTSTTTPAPTSPPPTCVVPKLVGLTLTAAQGAALRHHCRLTVGYASNKKVLKGRVVAQWFAPGRRFPRSTQVPIIVSKGRH